MLRGLLKHLHNHWPRCWASSYSYPQQHNTEANTAFQAGTSHRPTWQPARQSHEEQGCSHATVTEHLQTQQSTCFWLLHAAGCVPELRACAHESTHHEWLASKAVCDGSGSQRAQNVDHADQHRTKNGRPQASIGKDLRQWRAPCISRLMSLICPRSHCHQCWTEESVLTSEE